MAGAVNSGRRLTSRPAGSVEAEELGGEFAAGLAEEQLGGFEERGVELAVAVAGQEGG